jgi:hypothetical protein
VRDVVGLDGVAAGARPASAKGGERAHSHADTACVLKRLIIQAEGGGVLHSIEPHAAGPAGDAIKEGPGSVGGPKAPQLCTVGCCEDVADLGGQLGELHGYRVRQALGRRGAQFGELSMQEVPGCRGCAGRCGKRV